MDPPATDRQPPQLPPPAPKPSLPAGMGVVEPPAAAASAATAEATALPTQPLSAPFATAIRLSLLPCKNCRAMHAKCVGGFPCNRCFDLGQTCVPGSSGTGAASKGRKRPKDRGDSAAAEEGLAVVAQSASPMDLAYLSSDPLPFAELYARACVRVFEEGRCSRGHVVRFLRKWRRESQRFGADVTVGMAKVLQERAGIDPMELVDRDELLHGPTDAARRARLAAEQAAQAKLAGELLEWGIFKRASIGGAAAYCVRIDEQGRYADVANVAFQRLMGGAGWPGRHMQACKMLSPYLGASLCAPADRQMLLQAIADNCLEHSEGPRRTTHMIKGFFGDGSDRGRVGLMIATLERFELDDGAIVLVMRMEPAPPSRHLTARPAASSGAGPGASSRKRGKGAAAGQGGVKPDYRQTTLADAMTAGGAAAGAAGAVGAAGPSAAGHEQQPQDPSAFAFPSVAVVPGVALPAGGGAFLDAAAEALFARRARPEEKEQPAATGTVPSIEPGLRRGTRRRRAAGAAAEAGGGGDSSEAAGAWVQVQRAPASPVQPLAPLAPLAVEQEHAGGGALLYDGPLSLESVEWEGLFDERLSLHGNPIRMEDVFK